MWELIFILSLFVSLEVRGVYYDTYRGTILSDADMEQHIDDNTTFRCTIDVAPCDPNEGRRIDGTCNDLSKPSRGATQTPFIKVLRSDFGPGFSRRPSVTGGPLELTRRIRTAALPTGTRKDFTFNQLAMHFFTLAFDFVGVRFRLGPRFIIARYVLDYFEDLVPGASEYVNYSLQFITLQSHVANVWSGLNCCGSEDRLNFQCVPQPVPEDDFVFRFTNIRCLNLTRPVTYQQSGCTRNGTTPDRVSTATPVIDLTTVYGNDVNSSRKGRLFSGGLLKTVRKDSRTWPPRIRTTPNICIQNQLPTETRCHDTPDDATNTFLGINLFSIWFWRQHNLIATALAEQNDRWSDEKLFQTAKDINIAIAAQIFYYEFLPLLLGRENLISNRVISTEPGFRDVYNSSISPQISLEFPYIMRWAHTVQEGRLKMYDTSGNYLKQIPIVNLTLRTGYLAIDNNIDYITQGSFRQASAKTDYIIDPQMGDKVFGGLQQASDVATSDLAKGRYMGIPSYVKYRTYCTGRTYRNYIDLLDVMEFENMEILKEYYKSLDDIELLAGVWLENLIDGGLAPPTVYCLMVEQLLRTIKSDRHWYERPNRPNAFKWQQLQEIRKATVSRLLCDVGDKVTSIQKYGFLRIGASNKLTSCNNIVRLNLTAWKDNGDCDTDPNSNTDTEID